MLLKFTQITSLISMAGTLAFTQRLQLISLSSLWHRAIKCLKTLLSLLPCIVRIAHLLLTRATLEQIAVAHVFFALPCLPLFLFIHMYFLFSAVYYDHIDTT